LDDDHRIHHPHARHHVISDEVVLQQMVNYNSRHIRVGKEFNRLRMNFKTQLEPTIGKISDRELTDSIARFLEQENLDKLMMRKALRRRGGGLF
jgi:hypothetical protein